MPLSLVSDDAFGSINLNIYPFLSKLLALVEDPECDDLIAWNPVCLQLASLFIDSKFNFK